MTLATVIAFSSRVWLFDALAVAASVLLILNLALRLVLEAAQGPTASPRVLRMGTGPLLAVFCVCAVARVILVAAGLY